MSSFTILCYKMPFVVTHVSIINKNLDQKIRFVFCTAGKLRTSNAYVKCNIWTNHWHQVLSYLTGDQNREANIV